jgi:murein L,D-transpeptidase YafK
VATRLVQYGPAARARMTPRFERAGLSYPPAQVTLVALKDVARLELWAAGTDGALRHVRDYDVRAASGGAGPKLREGDLQVPEGIYQIDWLNPRSAYHLSLHIDYPNARDRERAALDGREGGGVSLGGDIMIHGDEVSVGCLAMGDAAAEELFVLAADTGVGAGDASRVRVILAPTDLRVRSVAPRAGDPAWLVELYAEIAAAMPRQR